METILLPRPVSVGLFVDPALKLTKELKNCQMDIAGLCRCWQLLVMPECPEEVV